jgi:hypothetical protein
MLTDICVIDRSGDAPCQCMTLGGASAAPRGEFLERLALMLIATSTLFDDHQHRIPDNNRGRHEGHHRQPT